MENSLNEQQIYDTLRLDDVERLKFTVKEIVAHNQVWILVDEHGAVMLNTEDEDCVPIWPHEAFARRWATGEWEACEPHAISFNKWQSRWTQGLIDDDLSLVVFPNEDEQGLVLFPDEFEQEMSKGKRKR